MREIEEANEEEEEELGIGHAVKEVNSMVIYNVQEHMWYNSKLIFFIYKYVVLVNIDYSKSTSFING